MGRKKKESNYNCGAARASLNAPHAHHFQVYSAAVSSNINAIEETPPAISPTKEEVKAERDMLHSIAICFERKLDSSCRKIESLESKSRLLANSLKEEDENFMMKLVPFREYWEVTFEKKQMSIVA